MKQRLLLPGISTLLGIFRTLRRVKVNALYPMGMLFKGS